MEGVPAALALGNLKAIQEAAKEFGIMPRADFNDGSNEGTGFFEVNQKNGIRWSTAKGFLRPALKRRNLRLLTHAATERIIVEGRRVTGVRFWLNHQPVEALARCEVILAAGAINTPKILEMSGIGNPELLQKLGIKTVLDRPAVGENLQDHLQIRTVFKVRGAKTLNTLANSRWGKARIGLQYLVTQSGPMSMAPSQFGMFTKSDPSLIMPNLEYHVQPLSTNRIHTPEAALWRALDIAPVDPC
jgi:choline dehydrogenase